MGEVIDLERVDEERDEVEEKKGGDDYRLTTDDVARIFNVSRQTIVYWKKKNMLDYVKMPDGSTRFSVDSVKKLLKKKYGCGDDVADKIISGEMSVKDLIKSDQKRRSFDSDTESIVKMINVIADKVAEIEARLNAISGKEKIVEREIDIEEGVRIKKSIELSPKTIQYYNYIVGKVGVNMTIDEFINEVIDEHMSECLGVEIAVVTRVK
jgi:DNA-binding transcriptional MerR regulator